MEWTDIQITVPQQYAETAEAIATMVSNGGIYIEDYRDLEQQAWEIAHVDLIEQELLDLLAVPRTVSQWSELGLAAPSRAATSSSSISTLVTHVFSGIG